MHGCSKDEHSWAWISPSGEFTPVDDHGTWAAQHPKYRKEIVDLLLADGPRDLLTSRGFSYMDHSDKKIRVSPAYFDLMTEKLVNSDLDQLTPDTDPPTLNLPRESFTEYKINPLYSDLPEVKRKLRKFPLLQETWTSKTKLTRFESEFIFWMDDEYGEGEWVDEKKIVKPNSHEVKLRSAWRSLVWFYIHNVRSIANKTLVKYGWMAAGNPFNAWVSDTDNTAQWDAFFTEGVKCYKLDPMLEEFHVQLDSSYIKTTYGEALERFASRRVSDHLFGVVMDRHHKMASRVAAAYVRSQRS